MYIALQVSETKVQYHAGILCNSIPAANPCEGLGFRIRSLLLSEP